MVLRWRLVLLAKLQAPASLIAVIEAWGTCPEVRNVVTTADCGVHMNGSTCIFVNGHAKWLRVVHTLFPTLMWVTPVEGPISNNASRTLTWHDFRLMLAPVLSA